MLNRLITVAIVIGVAYVLLTKAVPMIFDQFSGTTVSTEGTASSEDGRCVDQAVGANDLLTSTARQYGQPPVDVEAWSDAQWEIESQIQSAASACGCMSDACRTASEAIDEMRGLLSNLDGMVRGNSPGFANPANQQERIYKLLNRAQTAAGY